MLGNDEADDRPTLGIKRMAGATAYALSCWAWRRNR